MATKIRLARTGSKKRPHYRIVVADSRMPRDGRYIEQIGTYHPLYPKDSEDRVRMDFDKAKDWMSKGAKPTDRVSRMLEAAGMLQPVERSNPKKSQPKKKAQERAAAEAGGGDEAAPEASTAATDESAEASAPAETTESGDSPATESAPAEDSADSTDEASPAAAESTPDEPAAESPPAESDASADNAASTESDTAAETKNE